MLSELYIENIAVISQAGIVLEPGLNVFTGETGAGKTMLISAINAVLGARTSRDIIRTGETRGMVSALFTGIPEDVAEEIGALGFGVEDGQLLVTRTLEAGGGGSSKIGGRPATAALLREVCGRLIDIHGQHDNQELLSPDRHLDFLDNFGGLLPQRRAYGEAYRQVQGIREELEQLQLDESYKLQRQDILTYQIGEIEETDPQQGEEEELHTQRERIKNAEKITFALGSIYDLLNGQEEGPGILESIGILEEQLEVAAPYIPGLSEYQDRATEALYTLQELSAAARGSLDELDFDPRQLDDIESRLDQLYKLTRKYGGTVEAVLEHLEQSRQELDLLVFSEERARQLTQWLEDATAQAQALAQELSQARSRSAREFLDLVGRELAYLDMAGVTLTLDQRPKPLGPTGADQLELLIVTNPGEPPKPLSRIASGGELARIMLAVKTVLADKDGVGSIIFDEVDSGVSGRAAQKIGQKLAQVGQNRQVICVTHLAPVAAWGDHHIRIYKTVEDGRTHTRVQPLTRQERMEELARITVGEHITDISLQNASEMLAAAGK